MLRNKLSIVLCMLILLIHMVCSINVWSGGGGEGGGGHEPPGQEIHLYYYQFRQFIEHAPKDYDLSLFFEKADMPIPIIASLKGNDTIELINVTRSVIVSPRKLYYDVIKNHPDDVIDSLENVHHVGSNHLQSLLQQAVDDHNVTIPVGSTVGLIVMGSIILAILIVSFILTTGNFVYKRVHKKKKDDSSSDSEDDSSLTETESLPEVNTSYDVMTAGSYFSKFAVMKPIEHDEGEDDEAYQEKVERRRQRIQRRQRRIEARVRDQGSKYHRGVWGRFLKFSQSHVYMADDRDANVFERFSVCHYFIKKTKKLRHLVGKFMESRFVQCVLLILLVLDIIALLVELLLEAIYPHSIVTPHFVHVIEDVLYYFTVVILAVFLLEMFVLIFAFGWHFFTHPLYVLDLVFVLAAFSVEVLFKNHLTILLGNLFTLIRLWRVVRIIQTVILFEEEKYHIVHHHLEAQLKKKAKLKTKMKTLKRQSKHSQKINPAFLGSAITSQDHPSPQGDTDLEQVPSSSSPPTDEDHEPFHDEGEEDMHKVDINDHDDKNERSSLVLKK